MLLELRVRTDILHPLVHGGCRKAHRHPKVICKALFRPTLLPPVQLAGLSLRDFGGNRPDGVTIALPFTMAKEPLIRGVIYGWNTSLRPWLHTLVSKDEVDGYR